jgi:hypothetical protein
MIKHAKKIVIKNFYFKNNLFSTLTLKNIFKTYLNFILKSWSASLSLLSQPHFERSVRSSLTLLKMGLGSPPGLPKTQSAIVGVKTPCIEVFFIPLERS